MNARFRLMLALSLILALACSSDAGTGVTRPLDVDASLAKGGGGPKINKPTPVSNTTLDVNSCEFTVTFSWSTYRGEHLTAVVGLYQGGTVARIADVSVTDQSGKSGSITQRFQLQAGGYAGGRYVLGMGHLLDRDLQEVTGSRSGSTLVWSDCG